MKTNANTANELIDRLADKTLSFGCMVEAEDVEFHKGIHKFRLGDWNCEAGGYNVEDTVVLREEITKILGHPILIGDVLEKFVQKGRFNELIITTLAPLWRKCGFTRSLQGIAEDVEEVIFRNADETSERYEMQLKPEAQVLFDFLIELL